MNTPPLPIPTVAAWPDPPRRWSHSSLTAAEACPLRWAFSRATYTDGSRGFPERPSEAALRGQVVHLAVEEVLGALATAGCRSVDSAEAARVLLDLGGITEVVRRCVETILAGLPTHARAARVADALARTLRQEVPTLRDRVGPFVRRAHLRPRPDVPPSASSSDNRSSARRPLAPGSHTEVWVECADPPMGGRVDILSLGPDAVEIADVKAGRASAAHTDQLVTYGVLWLRDAALNPSARAATALAVLYPTETTTVPLPDWDAAAAALSARTCAASASVGARPVPATPSPDACRWCAARPACPAYWEAPLPQPDETRFVDVDLAVDRELGPDLWIVTVHACPAQPDLVGPAMLVTRSGHALRSHSRVRILGARLLDPDPAAPGTVLSTSASTEVFRVDVAPLLSDPVVSGPPLPRR